MEALKAWEQGKGAQVLKQRLWVAEREKPRYMANRIAQTELARAHQDKVAAQIMADDTITVVQVKLNPRHPLPDICDLHARADLWGLGPGLYPKAKAPKPPFHPHCWCRLVTRPDKTAEVAREREDAVRVWLRTLPAAEAARVLGNRQRLDYVLNGADWERVTQAAVRDEYRLRRVGDNPQMRFFKQPTETFGPYDPGAPRVKPDISTPARRVAVEIEDAIRRDEMETGVFIASDGQVLLRRQGQPDRVKYLESELRPMRGTIFTHNHPGGAGFSVEDVILASEFGFDELRAVTSNFRHVAYGIPAFDSAEWQRAYALAESEVAPMLIEMVRAGDLHPKDFGVEARHRAWARVAKHFNFLYVREKS